MCLLTLHLSLTDQHNHNLWQLCACGTNEALSPTHSPSPTPQPPLVAPHPIHPTPSCPPLPLPPLPLVHSLTSHLPTLSLPHTPSSSVLFQPYTQTSLFSWSLNPSLSLAPATPPALSTTSAKHQTLQMDEVPQVLLKCLELAMRSLWHDSRA